MECNYCGKEAEFMSSKEFYGRDYGVNMYVCRPCDAYTSTHGKGKTPKGTLATPRLRKLRMTAHSIFDPLWRGKYRRMSRGKAYRWMQEAMDMTPEQAHIGMMNEEQCQELILKLKEFRGIN